MKQTASGSWQVIDPAGRVRIDGEGYQVASNIVAGCNSPRCRSGECGEVAKQLMPTA